MPWRWRRRRDLLWKGEHRVTRSGSQRSDTGTMTMLIVILLVLAIAALVSRRIALRYRHARAARDEELRAASPR